MRDGIVTGDALFCQRDLCETIIDPEGNYVFFAKQVRAALRNGMIHALSGVAASSLAVAMRTMSNCFTNALELLGLPQLE